MPFLAFQPSRPLQISNPYRIKEDSAAQSCATVEVLLHTVYTNIVKRSRVKSETKSDLLTGMLAAQM